MGFGNMPNISMINLSDLQGMLPKSQQIKKKKPKEKKEKPALDIHAITASQVFDVPLDQVDSTLRRKAKAVNFGIVYGISSFGLGQDLDISRKEAEGYIEKYFAT